MNENKNEYFTGVLLVITGILSTALYIDGFYFQSAIFHLFSSGFSRWAENMFGIFSIMMFSIPAIAGVVLMTGEKSLNRFFMLAGYILLAFLIPPFFHKISGNNYNAGYYGMKVSEIFSGSGSTPIEAAIYFLWLGLSVGFLLFPLRSKIVEQLALLFHIETASTALPTSSKNKKTSLQQQKKVHAVSEASDYNNTLRKSESFRIASEPETKQKDIFEKSFFHSKTNESDFFKKDTSPKRSMFEVHQHTKKESIPWVSKVIYEAEDKRMEVPVFSKAPIKKFRMKKNEDQVEEYQQVDTLSSGVYKTSSGVYEKVGDRILKPEINTQEYFEKIKKNWPESWKSVNQQENSVSDVIENTTVISENTFSVDEMTENDVIPDDFEETTEAIALNETSNVQEVEGFRIVSGLDDQLENSAFLDKSKKNVYQNPFLFDEDNSFSNKEDLDFYGVEKKTQEVNLEEESEDDWDFRKAEAMDKVLNEEWEHSELDSEEENCDLELLNRENEQPPVWKSTPDTIDSDDIKKFLHENMESYSRFRQTESIKPEVLSEEEKSPFSSIDSEDDPSLNNNKKSFQEKKENVPLGLFQQAMQMRNNSTMPDGNLLKENTHPVNREEYQRIEMESAKILETTLAEFGIKAEVCDIIHGPVVTLFKIIPAPGIKLSRIESLSDNLALHLAAQSIRIIAPIPGEKVVGIEVPNKKRELVSFKEVINNDSFVNNSYQVPVGLGKDIYGKVITIDIHKMPHILIAGATGAGKSVCVNGFLCSILFSRSPEDVRMILIDPKVVELQPYDGIPHLLTPVITDPKDAVNALKYLVYEMEERYKLLGKIGVRSIVEYRKMIKEGKLSMTNMPFIICIVDEFADLMTTAGKEAEMLFARLTAKARAVGIHLVLATQRPSTDVITGLIKSNVPARIAFQVISYQDSRIILDQKGAEKLLGQGDMLYLSPTQPHPVRLQGAFLDKEEVDLVVEHWKSLGEPEYIDIGEILGIDDEDSGFSGGGDGGSSNDPLYDEAVEVVIQSQKASASYLQRRLSIGYNRAARLIEEMEEQGIVGPMQGSKPREVFGGAAGGNEYFG